mmetsp:Transcript_16035/g.38321  ORF Transcript_16035/g.38321 Transcript_16035/m.38321 type:complete len:491 (-) Transcript_16035:643-2115(-)
MEADGLGVEEVERGDRDGAREGVDPRREGGAERTPHPALLVHGRQVEAPDLLPLQSFPNLVVVVVDRGRREVCFRQARWLRQWRNLRPRRRTPERRGKGRRRIGPDPADWREDAERGGGDAAARGFLGLFDGRSMHLLHWRGRLEQASEAALDPGECFAVRGLRNDDLPRRLVLLEVALHKVLVDPSAVEGAEQERQETQTEEEKREDVHKNVWFGVWQEDLQLDFLHDAESEASKHDDLDDVAFAEVEGDRAADVHCSVDPLGVELGVVLVADGGQHRIQEVEQRVQQGAADQHRPAQHVLMEHAEREHGDADGCERQHHDQLDQPELERDERHVHNPVPLPRCRVRTQTPLHAVLDVPRAGPNRPPSIFLEDFKRKRCRVEPRVPLPRDEVESVELRLLSLLHGPCHPIIAHVCFLQRSMAALTQQSHSAHNLLSVLGPGARPSPQLHNPQPHRTRRHLAADIVQVVDRPGDEDGGEEEEEQAEAALA